MKPTPTCNQSLPHRYAGFSNVCQALDYAAKGETGVNFYNVEGELTESLSYAALRELATTLAARWAREEHLAGAVIGMIAETSPEFLVHFYAAQYAGLVPCPLPCSPRLGAPEAYLASLRTLLTSVAPAAVYAPQSELGIIAGAASDARVYVAYEELDAGIAELPSEAQTPPILDREALAILQLSSGSTSAPRCVRITQSALMQNASAIATSGLRMRVGDRACSWLPFYHDMGLVGFSIVALCSQCSVDYLKPQAFAARPEAWLRLMSDRGSTVSYGPAFAWRLVSERIRNGETFDLSALRVAGVGGDMIPPDLFDRCSTALFSTGFRRSSFQASYGMAEATLAVCMSSVDEVPNVQSPRARQPPSNSGQAYVGCGMPLPGVEVRVEDPDGEVLGEGCIGEIVVRGPGVITQDHSDQSSGRGHPRDDGFFRTGDLGFVSEGEIFPAGRIKDLVIVRGRNMRAQEIEWAVERLDEVSRGDVAAIGVPDALGEESLALLIQRLPRSDHESIVIRQKVQEIVAANFGVHVDVIFIPRRSFSFTSSGKLARWKLRTRYLDGGWAIGDRLNQAVDALESSVEGNL